MIVLEKYLDSLMGKTVTYLQITFFKTKKDECQRVSEILLVKLLNAYSSIFVNFIFHLIQSWVRSYNVAFPSGKLELSKAKNLS